MTLTTDDLAGSDTPTTEPTSTATPGLGDEPQAPQLGDEADDAGDTPVDAAGTPALGDEAADDEQAGEPAEGEGEGEGDDEPIEYDFGEAPEGQPAYREKVVEAYKAAVGKLKLPNDQAKQLLDEMLPTLQADVNSQLKAQIDEQSNAWQKELEERHGDNLSAVVRLGNKALSQFASKELRQFIANSPLRHNPDFHDMLAAVGQRFTNDPSVRNGTDIQPSGATLSAEEEAAQEYEREAARERAARR